MQFLLENRGGIRADETGQQFNSRAQRILTDARSHSEGLCNGLSEIYEQMDGVGQVTGDATLDGGALFFQSDRMREKASNIALPSRADHSRLS